MVQLHPQLQLQAVRDSTKSKSRGERCIAEDPPLTDHVSGNGTWEWSRARQGASLSSPKGISTIAGHQGMQ